LQNKERNIFSYPSSVTRASREARNKHRSVVLWLTGFSGAGKSTLANGLEDSLFKLGYFSSILDGDNIRCGLSSDLGFMEIDRRENIRRVGEVAKLFTQAGAIVIVALISPMRADREMVRRQFPDGDFLEVYCSANLEACESRDVKGLYKKARSGLIKNFTGVDSAYEQPLAPDLEIDSSKLTIEDSVLEVLNFLERRKVF
jgi:adenylylsulfate kinase